MKKLVDDNDVKCKDNDIEDSIADNETNPTSNVDRNEGGTRSYMFEPASMNERNNFDDNDKGEHHNIRCPKEFNLGF